MDCIYRLVLALNATSWMVVVYVIKDYEPAGNMSDIILALSLLLVPVLVSIFALYLSKWFKISNDTLTSCEEIRLADNEFLPVYLGYFFVALSVPNKFTLVFVYLIVFLFSFLSGTQYFNPLFLLFGYHYYHVKTNMKTNIFLISRGPVIRNPDDVDFEKLRRVNDTTYIAC